MTLKCDIRQRDDVTILDLRGFVRLRETYTTGSENRVALDDKIRELIEKGQKKILLNLADVIAMDSSGVGQLIGAFTTARNHGADLKLMKPTSHVGDLLKITKLDTVLDIHNDEDKAIKAFAKGAAAKA